jgi:hypothetical protein
MYFELFETIFSAAPDPVTAVDDFFTGAAEVLRATDYADACPIAVVALEVASTNDTLRAATTDVFESWITGAASHLIASGIEPVSARELAILLINILEGAFILSRAARTTEAMEVARVAAVTATRAACERR